MENASVRQATRVPTAQHRSTASTHALFEVNAEMADANAILVLLVMIAALF